MKNMKTLFVAIALLVGATSFMNAQTKIAHINAQELIENMPEYKTAQSTLDKVQRTYDTEIKAMAKEFQTKMQQYDGEAASKTDVENQKRVEEIQGMENNIAQYRQQALQDLDKKRSDLFQPILEKAQSTIQKVAKGLGYQYVLDSTVGSGVILADGKDIMPEVKKDLGI